ncbi:RNA-directed DNA polymerase [Pseudomonas sp. MM211]|uniref:antiviral reverse transcriptase Drt4 n=1 Tax=Pseudomonas sp. MM211 TaxID=2866808 RepID=UPI001CEC811E|nr:antiviral reverse transcriptase Drt4 [Pseudomonas sp. MM211]UCJ18908.1 RNA-directed DNA polymerase [Pseudomonas sp. MM211]
MKSLAITNEAKIPPWFEDRSFQEGLTRWNYFPNQKDAASELPPSICTKRFTPEIASLLAIEKSGSERGIQGFDVTEYRATRYNNIPRSLGLIHPLAYSKIFSALASHKTDIEDAMRDENSQIQMGYHLDGRIFIMNYEDQDKKSETVINQCFGKKFLAHSDISNCFGSVYTHSLEWAEFGLEQAKANLTIKPPIKSWSAKLDSALQLSKRKETIGIPIGPASSSIAVEIILASVDKNLREDFNFVRYIDDYTAFCSSHDEAQRFIQSLDKEISKFRLTLSLSKTSIVELPEPLEDNWIAQLMTSFPIMELEKEKLTIPNTRDAIRFLDYAVQLNNRTPDASVIKYATSAVAHRVTGHTAYRVFQYILSLCWHYPVLLPYLEKIDLEITEFITDDIIEKLNAIIKVNAAHRRSDGICWCLYYLERLESSPSDESADEIIKCRDSVSITMLSRFDEHIEKVKLYANELISKHIYERDQNWLLLYQLYYLGMVANAYPDENTFELLKFHEVDFFSNTEESKAENYCQIAYHPFADLENIVPYTEWLKTL